MPFALVLIFLLIRMQGGNWPAAPDRVSLQTTSLIAWAVPVFSWAFAGLIAYVFTARLVRDEWPSWQLMNRFAVWRRYHFYVLLATYLGSVYFFGWGYFAQVSCAYYGIPAPELLTFAPFIATLLLAWERFGRFEKAVFDLTHAPDQFIGIGSYVAFQARQNLLLTVPFMFLCLVYNCALLVEPSVRLVYNFLGPLLVEPSVREVPQLILLVPPGALALICIPYLLRVFLHLKPLPSGSLRTQLEAVAVRLRFHYNDILVWNTRNTMANAMVTGVIPWVRYVIFTDRLIDELTPEELEAVFGHEVGHIRYHHMAVYLLFGALSFLVLGAAGVYLDQVMNPYIDAAKSEWPELADAGDFVGNIVAVAFTGLYFFFVFGALARRCERQADLFGCQAASSQALMSALEKVVEINGISRDRPGWFSRWLHPTIAQRIVFLQRASTDPSVESRYHFSLVMLKLTMLVTLPCLIWALLHFCPDMMMEMIR